jgi:hypothetical protein
MKLVTSLFLLVAICACSSTVATRNEARAISDEISGEHLYKMAFIDAIRRSNRIVVVQHSFKFDLYDVEAHKSLIPEEVVYQSRELDTKQKDDLLATMKAMPEKVQEWETMCIFEPHHRIEFYLDSGEVSSMEICFRCQQVQWSGSAMRPPLAFLGTIASFFERVGLATRRSRDDWSAMAKAHLEQ